MELIPHDATRMELLVVKATLDAIKTRILGGEPSGLVIDQALEEAMQMAMLSKRQEEERSTAPMSTP